MSTFSWYLVVTLIGSDDLLVKEMTSKEECIKEQKMMMSKVKKKIKYISDITCEEGTIFQQYENAGVKDEAL